MNQLPATHNSNQFTNIMATALIHAMLLIMVVHTALCAFGGLVGRTQSAGVRGILLCNGRPEPNVLVKLYDDDRGLDFDDLMAEGRSDSNGRFELSGNNAEVTPIDPKLNIYHDCNDGWWPCQRKISIMIPDSYITVGPRPKEFYDAGTIELSGKYKGETRDCLH
ncbi:Transthyretin-like protein 5 [Toxocara canis]|uniref:Transthyretin-like protein 5 n=1 Tax=Toxocara canis TaxID=6265 RepID=A0A0B2W5M4_TOXCA|nr:Transthyretin-like protein 5 [Toxocara canis]